MKMFGYYALHSFINQLRKLFKTWVLIFILLCGLMGGLIGFGAGMLFESVDEEDYEEYSDESSEDTDLIFSGDSSDEPLTLDTVVLDMEGLGSATLRTILEWICGAVVLGVFIFEIFSADKNGSKIFLPADVNLLFASPLKPQEVLLFRLMMQIGTALFASIYLICQLPTLVGDGLSIWAAVGILLGWLLTIFWGKLAAVFMYVLGSTHPAVRKNQQKLVIGLLIVLAGAFSFYRIQTGMDTLQAADAFFNSPASRFVPVWGWLKTFVMLMVEENLPAAAGLLALLIVSLFLALFGIGHMKADFYEEAMAKSEETAQMMEDVQSGRSLVGVRKKTFSEKLRRDGMKHGWGASVFFFKPLYNRFRFAKLGFLTKTNETYFLTAAGIYILCRFGLDANPFLPGVLALGGMAFFRTLGNPLESDVKTSWFLMIPENPWKKLMYSLLSGACECALDLLPAFVFLTILCQESPVSAFGWLILIISIDFYATTVGVFIDLSVPVNAGVTLKQVVQIMFIYFGLLPDIAIMAVGIVQDHILLASCASFLVNAGLGCVFFGVTPLFLEPASCKKREEISFEGDTKAIRRQFLWVGAALSCLVALAVGLQYLAAAGVNWFLPSGELPEWLYWICTFAPIYAAAIPVCLLIMKKAEAVPPAEQSFSLKDWFCTFAICVFLMYVGNLTGTGINALIDLVLPSVNYNVVLSLTQETSLGWQFLFMVILAPALEELVFRKALIDRLHSYGGKRAVIFSALAFGLFHGNFSQFFYAFLLGLVFGYVYLKTGKLRYSISLHMTINFMGSVVASLLLKNLDLVALESNAQTAMTPALAAYLVYLCILIILFFTGLVLFFIRQRDVSYETEEKELPVSLERKLLYGNVGVILYGILCAGMFLLNYLV